MTKSEIKLVRSLHQKKFRDELGLFIAEGDKCINELRKYFELVLLADSTNATPTEIEQMSMLRAPQGSIAVFKKDRCADGIRTADADGIRTVHTPYSISEQSERSILLCLDGIQDPGNLGTIIRTADWFGVHDIVCSLDTVDCYNPKVVQATMGALTRVRVHYTDLAEWLRHGASGHSDKKAQIPIYGTLLDGKNMYSNVNANDNANVNVNANANDNVNVNANSNPSIIIMGNEGNGISKEVRELVTHPIRIPSYPPDAETSESLNVAIATAIVLAEFRRPK